MNPDWSAMHQLIRATMLLVSLAMFVLARHEFFLSAAASEHVSQTVDIPVIELLLFCIVIYLALQFRYHTRAEIGAITSHVAKLHRTVSHVEQLETRTARLLDQAKGALLTERLDIWDKSIDRASVMPTREDAETLEKLRAQLHDIDMATIRMQLAAASIDDDHLDDENGKATDRAVPADTIPQVENLNELVRIGREFEQRTQALEEAVEATRSILQDVRTIFADSDDSTAGDISAKLETALDEIGKVKTLIQGSGSTHLGKRLFHSVTLPSMAASLLILMSADAVIAGGIKVFVAITSSTGM